LAVARFLFLVAVDIIMFYFVVLEFIFLSN